MVKNSKHSHNYSPTRGERMWPNQGYFQNNFPYPPKKDIKPHIQELYNPQVEIKTKKTTHRSTVAKLLKPKTK